MKTEDRLVDLQCSTSGRAPSIPTKSLSAMLDAAIAVDTRCTTHRAAPVEVALEVLFEMLYPISLLYSMQQYRSRVASELTGGKLQQRRSLCNVDLVMNEWRSRLLSIPKRSAGWGSDCGEGEG